MNKKKVLIVDDSATERKVLADLLNGYNFEISFAQNGDEGVEVAKSLKPDLILMDVVMPHTNGYAATRTLSKDEVTKDIPVIMCTTRSADTDKVWGMKQGAKDYLVKPIDKTLLIDKIKKLNLI